MPLNCYPPAPPEQPNHNEGAMILAMFLGALLVIAVFGWYSAEANKEEMQRELNNEIHILKAREATNEAVQV